MLPRCTSFVVLSKEKYIGRSISGHLCDVYPERVYIAHAKKKCPYQHFQSFLCSDAKWIVFHPKTCQRTQYAPMSRTRPPQRAPVGPIAFLSHELPFLRYSPVASDHQRPAEQKERGPAHAPCLHTAGMDPGPPCCFWTTDNSSEGPTGRPIRLGRFLYIKA